LYQIGLARNSVVPRPDHWQPILVAAGFPLEKQAHYVVARTLHQRVPKFPLPKKETLTPVPHTKQQKKETAKLRSETGFIKTQHFHPAIPIVFKVPEAVSEPLLRFFDALNVEWGRLAELDSTETTREPEITLHWLRPEYKDIVMESGKTLPLTVNHQELQLVRGRYPLVDGFNMQLRMDQHVVDEGVTPLHQVTSVKEKRLRTKQDLAAVEDLRRRLWNE